MLIKLQSWREPRIRSGKPPMRYWRHFPDASEPGEYEQYVRILYAPTLLAATGHGLAYVLVRSIYQQITLSGDPVVDDGAHIKAAQDAGSGRRE